MTRDEIRDRLAGIIRKETAYRGDVTDDMRLIEDIGADSLQLMAIVTSAETVFKVTISDEALFEIQRVGDAVDVVAAGLAASQA
jgi:acyl carrier protein